MAEYRQTTQERKETDIARSGNLKMDPRLLIPTTTLATHVNGMDPVLRLGWTFPRMLWPELRELRVLPARQLSHQLANVATHPALFASALAQSPSIPLDLTFQGATVVLRRVFDQGDDGVDGFGVGVVEVAGCRVLSYGDQGRRDVVGDRLQERSFGRGGERVDVLEA